MQDFESFSSADNSLGSGSTPESFREFQNRMQIAAAQIKLIRAQENRQKQKEDKLAELLSRFIRNLSGNDSHQQLLVLISKLIEKNIPASFILALIILNFPDLQKESGLLLLTTSKVTPENYGENLPVLFESQRLLPPWAKLALNSWFELIQTAAMDVRHKMEQIYNYDDIKALFIFSLELYLKENNFSLGTEYTGQFADMFFRNLKEMVSQPQNLLEN